MGPGPFAVPSEPVRASAEEVGWDIFLSNEGVGFVGGVEEFERSLQMREMAVLEHPFDSWMHEVVHFLYQFKEKDIAHETLHCLGCGYSRMF